MLIKQAQPVQQNDGYGSVSSIL